MTHHMTLKEHGEKVGYVPVIMAEARVKRLFQGKLITQEQYDLLQKGFVVLFGAYWAVMARALPVSTGRKHFTILQ